MECGHYQMKTASHWVQGWSQ